jgi:multidrug efflux pump subunit AcrB
MLRCRWLALVGLIACHKSPAAGPTLEVRVRYPGGSVTDVESAVTTPVERLCGKLPRVNRMHGYSLPERSLVTLELERGADLDDSLRRLQEQLRSVGQLLPQEASFPVATRGQGAIVARYGARSDTLPLVQLGELVDGAFEVPAAQTSGVGLVQACGQLHRQTTVDVDPAALARTGLTLSDVSETLGKAGAGTADALAPLILRYANGAPVRLKDVARIQDDAVTSDCRAFDERGPVTETLVRAQPGANPDDVRKVIDALAQKASAALPPGVELRGRTVERILQVDLDADASTAPGVQLQRAVAGVPGVGSFLVEVGPLTEADPPSGACVLLASRDDGLAGRVLAALRLLPFVRGAGEPNATVELSAAGWPELESASADLFRVLSARGELVLRLGVDRHPEPQPHVDRDTATRLGISMIDVGLALDARKGKVVTTDFTANGTSPDRAARRGHARPALREGARGPRAARRPGRDAGREHAGHPPARGAVPGDRRSRADQRPARSAQGVRPAAGRPPADLARLTGSPGDRACARFAVS